MAVKPLFLLGEAQGANEAKTGTPFVGASGIELLRMLDDAGVITLTSSDQTYMRRFWEKSDPQMVEMVWQMHPEIYRSNVFNQHPPGNEIDYFCGTKTEGIPGYPKLGKSRKGRDQYVRAEYAYELDRLGDEILNVDPNLIVCLGNAALWALCGIANITKNRGTTRLSTHTVSGYKVLGTYHPAYILRQWSERPVAVIDLAKANREKEFPDVRRPRREVWIEPSLQDIEEFYKSYIVGCRLLSVDIETVGTQITCIGFAPTTDRALVIPFVDDRKPGNSYWRTASEESLAWGWVRRICKAKEVRKLFQNGMYDIKFTIRSVKIPIMGAVEDSMLAHHALYPESLKGLEFLGSIYTDEGPWKKERKGTTTIKVGE
jgi:uracil-DNA glycosylase